MCPPWIRELLNLQIVEHLYSLSKTLEVSIHILSFGAQIAFWNWFFSPFYVFVIFSSSLSYALVLNSSELQETGRTFFLVTNMESGIRLPKFESHLCVLVPVWCSPPVPMSWLIKQDIVNYGDYLKVSFYFYLFVRFFCFCFFVLFLVKQDSFYWNLFKRCEGRERQKHLLANADIFRVGTNMQRNERSMFKGEHSLKSNLKFFYYVVIGTVTAQLQGPTGLFLSILKCNTARGYQGHTQQYWERHAGRDWTQSRNAYGLYDAKCRCNKPYNNRCCEQLVQRGFHHDE